MSSEQSLRGKTAGITGSGRRGGLGDAIAKRLAEEGCNIVISDIGQPRDAAIGQAHIGTAAEMESIAEALQALGVNASTKTCDVRSLKEVRALAKQAVDTHRSLDFWVNNVGPNHVTTGLGVWGPGRINISPT